jgi:hypothetical protein
MLNLEQVVLETLQAQLQVKVMLVVMERYGTLLVILLVVVAVVLVQLVNASGTLVEQVVLVQQIQ